ncbi:Rpa1ap, partial [Bonamia ostreae]
MDNLSKNAIIDISNGKTTTKPLLQIIHIQNMTKRGSASAERYIIILSDGRHHMEGVCTNNLGLAIKTGRIKNFAIVRLDEFRVNTAKNGKKVIVALKGELVNGAIGSEIGSSVSYADYSPDAETRKHRPTEAPKTEPKKFKPLNGDPNVLSDLEQSIVPLESLNPYRGKWAVRVRCTAVSPVRMWQKSTGSGKVMSVDLLDESGTEIRATMFNEAVDRFGDVFAEDKVYVIARGRVKLANKKFTHIRNDYEITLDAESVVQVVVDDRRIGKENYNFSALRDLESADENSFVDVLAVVSRIDPVASIMS